MEAKIKIGVSACLLGEKVRYDGGHTLDRFVADTLAPFVEYVPVCPEGALGLGVPREAMRLSGDPAAPRLVTIRSGKDHTAAMLAWAERWTQGLEREGLCGFIFKSKSPSCGIERVKLYGPGGHARKEGIGLFARAVRERLPLLPVEEEGRLNDPRLRESFIERIFVYRRWLDGMEGGGDRAALAEFHTRHKLLLMAHSPVLLRRLGRLAAGDDPRPFGEVAAEYRLLLDEALRLLATPRKQTNVLQHAMGYFKKRLDAADKAELGELIERYRLEQLPLIVPVTLLNHYVRKFDEGYLQRQWYLQPHPLELRLRNHV